MFTKTDIEKYFIAFKQENIFLITVGIIAIIIAMLFFFYYKTDWHRGFAIPLMVFGVMHAIPAYNNFKKADSLRKRNTYGYDMNPAGIKTLELKRVEEIYSKTNIFIYINIALMAGAVFLFLYYKNKEHNEEFKGIAIGLFIMTLITIGSSLYMQSQTSVYIKGILEFSSTAAERK